MSIDVLAAELDLRAQFLFFFLRYSTDLSYQACDGKDTNIRMCLPCSLCKHKETLVI